MLPGIGWCNACLPPFPTVCWWLTHPAAINGVSVSARWDSLGGFCFFAIAECRVHDTSSLQVCLLATVSCSQPEYSGLLMSCQMVDWVSRGVLVSSDSFPLTFLSVSEQGFGFLVSGGGHRGPKWFNFICEWLDYHMRLLSEKTLLELCTQMTSMLLFFLFFYSSLKRKKRGYVASVPMNY